MKRTMMILLLILTLSLTACGKASAPVATDTDVATETELATQTELATDTDTATETDAATDTDTPAVTENTPTAEKTGTQPQTTTEPQPQQTKPQTQRTSYLPEIEPEDDDEDEEMQVHVIGKVTDPSIPKTEETPAVHKHTWTPVYEEVPVYEDVHWQVCNQCGEKFGSANGKTQEDLSAHIKEHMMTDGGSQYHGEVEYIETGETTQELVGYVCAECGAKK